MIRAVFDTNVLVSGLTASAGNPFEAIEAWRRGQVNLLISEAIIAEVNEVLRRPFFRNRRGIQASDVRKVEALLRSPCRLVCPQVRLDVVEEDPDDDRVLECAIEGGADFLVSGDHHLLALKRYADTTIVTAAQFRSILHADHPRP